MSRIIIDIGTFIIKTYACGGKDECVQFTMSREYVSMTRNEAIDLLSNAVARLVKQAEDDKANPPFWQSHQKLRDYERQRDVTADEERHADERPHL